MSRRLMPKTPYKTADSKPKVICKTLHKLILKKNKSYLTYNKRSVGTSTKFKKGDSLGTEYKEKIVEWR